MDKNGCMNAINCTIDRDGYPRLSHSKNKKSPIARYIYEILNGPWEQGKVMRHLCNNRGCINPAHIVPGTQKENMMDRTACGKDPVGERNGRALVTKNDVIYIRKNPEKLTQRQLADKFGVTIYAISDIVTRRNWKHVA